MADLANWTGIANQQHRDYEAKIHDTSEQIVAIARELGIPNLEGEQARLTKLIGDQEHSLSSLNVRYADAENRKQKLLIAIKEINPKAVKYTAKIREMLDKIAEIDNELAEKTPLYTESNPKLLALHDRRDAAQAAYNTFLKTQGIDNFDPNTLDIAEKLQKEYEQVASDATTIGINITVLKAEIANNHELLNKIIECLPRLNQLKLLQDANLRAIETAESRLTDLNYLKTSAENELQPIEQANLSDHESPFNKKSVVIVLFLAVFLTSCCAVVLLILQLTFGRLRNFKELECYYDLEPIGAIPLYYQSYADGDSRGRFAFSELYYKFYQLRPNAKRAFIGTPEINANIPQTVGDALIRQFAANGKRLLLLRVVSAHNYEIPDTLTPLNAVFYAGNRGVFPVENPRTLSGSELLMLKEDLRELENDYDAIILICYGNMATCGILFQQMFDVCDTSILMVVPKQTQRSTLRYLLKIHQKAERKLYATMLDTHSYEKSNRG